MIADTGKGSIRGEGGVCLCDEDVLLYFSPPVDLLLYLAPLFVITEFEHLYSVLLYLSPSALLEHPYLRSDN